MDVLVLIARLVLAATFAVAGIAKLADPAGSRQSMVDFGLSGFLARPLAWLLPAAELACAAALIPVGSAWWGAVGVLALLLLFLAGIGVSMARGRAPDCHCFGQLHSSPVGWKTLIRNGALSAIAVFAVWQGPGSTGASVVNVMSGLGGWQVVTLAVAALAILELCVLIDVVRQNGRLLLRVEAVEASLRLGVGTKASAKGLPVDSPAPAFSLEAMNGGSVTLDTLREGGNPIVLMFTDSSCPPCDALLPELARWQEEHMEHLSIVPICRGSVEVNREKMARHHILNALIQTEGEPAGAYQAQVTPSAVLLRDGRIESPLAVGVEEIRALILHALLPPPLRRGEAAPDLRLPDLDGKTVEVVPRRGRRTLLLFWNPSCGFCQKMLADIKTWERNRTTDAPELVLVSAGSVQANRDQGFLSAVLLDPNSSTQRVFGATGTPSGVLLDEEGRVASEVGTGAEAVMALTGAAPVRQ